MYKFHCVITPNDTLVAYEAEDNDPVEPLFALVTESVITKQKASVLLSKQDAALLAQQLIAFSNKD